MFKYGASNILFLTGLVFGQLEEQIVIDFVMIMIFVF